MSLEKPQPLENDKGQINSPEIARKMAEHEERSRDSYKPYDIDEPEQAIIDTQAMRIGDAAHQSEVNSYEFKKIKEILEKVKNTLSEEELAILRRHTGIWK